MVQNAHEDHEVKGLPERSHVVNRKITEFDVKVVHFCGEPSLREILLAAVKAKHPVGAAPLHFHGVETRVATDVEDGLSFQAGRHHIRKATPFDPRIISQEMRRRRRHTVKVEVVKPWPQRIDLTANLVG